MAERFAVAVGGDWTGRSCAILRTHCSLTPHTALTLKSLETFRDLAGHLDDPEAGFVRSGHLILAPEGETGAMLVRDLERQAAARPTPVDGARPPRWPDPGRVPVRRRGGMVAPGAPWTGAGLFGGCAGCGLRRGAFDHGFEGGALAFEGAHGRFVLALAGLDQFVEGRHGFGVSLVAGAHGFSMAAFVGFALVVEDGAPLLVGVDHGADAVPDAGGGGDGSAGRRRR